MENKIQTRHTAVKVRRNFFPDFSPASFFLLFGSLFGLVFLLITPPFQTPDEPVHFYRSYQISEGNFIIDQTSKGAGGELPKSLQQTVNLTTKDRTIEFHPDIKYTQGLTRKALSIKEDRQHTRFYDLSATAQYSPIAYLPQSIGILVARLLHLPPVVMMYAGRLANLAMYIGMLWLAIKIMPYKKWALVAIGLLPMAMFQAISLSADVMAITMMILLLAQVLNLRQRSSIGWRQLLSLSATLLGLVLSKQVMFLFLPLVLLLPLKLFSSKRSATLQKGLLILGPFVIFLLWMYLVKDIKTSPNSVFTPHPAAQVRYILGNPLAYLGVLWNTFFFTPSDGIIRSFIGNFGWLDTPLSEFLTTIGYLGLAFLLLVAPEAHLVKPPGNKTRLLLIVLGVLYWLGVATALYVDYDTLKYPMVLGLQGRYFIPLAPLVLVLAINKRVVVDTKIYLGVAKLFPLLMLIVSAITIYSRYYLYFPMIH